MNDLLFLLRWLARDGRYRVTFETGILYRAKWSMRATRTVKTETPAGTADLTFTYNAEGGSTLRVLRNLSRAIQEAEE